jgi:2-deoxy-D-gluconate 3-dehydrogenase
MTMAHEVSFRLDDQCGIVTGAAGGIGQAIALGLAQAGAHVVLADLPQQLAAAEETAQRVRALGRQALVLALDVTSIASIQACVDQTVEAFGRLDYMVNNAGINIRKPVLDFTECDWDKVEAVNLKGVFFCTQYAARQMVKQGGGRMVLLASQLATVAMHDRAIYCITKAGVAHMAKCFAVELGGQGVSVNAIGPTFVATPLTTSMFTNPEFVAANLPKIPSGRFGTTDDVVGAVRFLLSPAADLINGHLLMVDGGYTAW